MKMWINGEWCDAESGETLFTINPTTNEKLGEVPSAGKADVDKAVAAARAAFPAWSARTQMDRSNVLMKIAGALAAKGQEMAEWDALEHGLPAKLAFGPSMASAGNFATAAMLARGINGELVKVSNPNAMFIMDRVPTGVFALINPWNMPLFLMANKVALCIATGNTCVLKPPSCNSIIGLKFAEVMAGVPELPKGVVNVITGKGGLMGKLLSDHPDIDGISFTGATDTGSTIIADAAPTCKKCIMELGGKNPVIIRPDANLDAAAEVLTHHQFFNCGQACGSPGRYYIHESVFDDFLKVFLEKAAKYVPGDPMKDGTMMGPLVTTSHLESVLHYIQTGIDEGATLVTGGKKITEGELAKGNFLPPTVFTNVTPDMTIYKEEIFGPVAVMTTYTDENEAVKLANDNTYGLTASIWSGNIARALKLGRGLTVGTFSINQHNCLGPEVSWGGVRQSGVGGREGGTCGLLAFLEEKVITISLDE